MTVWLLEGYGTDSRYPDDVRHREYTTSAKKAALFNQIPRIQFTDSGHGIEFIATEHKGRRLPERRMDYVREQMAKLASGGEDVSGTGADRAEGRKPDSQTGILASTPEASANDALARWMPAISSSPFAEMQSAYWRSGYTACIEDMRRKESYRAADQRPSVREIWVCDNCACDMAEEDATGPVTFDDGETGYICPACDDKMANDRFIAALKEQGSM